MRTVNRIVIDAPWSLVFSLAAAVENWPALLPHYRYVRLLSGSSRPVHGAVRTVLMAASRSHIPVHWTAEQTIDEDAMEIRYRHIGGVTVGMDVVWRLVPNGEGAVVTIDHVLDSPRPWLRNPFSALIVGQGFVVPIADATLAGIKRQAEIRAVGGASE